VSKIKTQCLVVLGLLAACGGDADSGSLDPEQFKGKLFKDLSVAEQTDLCVSIKAELAPLEEQFDQAFCMSRLNGQRLSADACKIRVNQLLELHELDKAKDPECKKDHELCRPLARVDEYLLCVEASKKAVADALSTQTMCDPDVNFKLTTPKECKTTSLNLECGEGGVISSFAKYW